MVQLEEKNTHHRYSDHSTERIVEERVAARSSTTNTVERKIETEKEKVKLTTKEHVQQFFSEAPAMIEVARCESGFRHFNSDGSVLRGYVNGADIGVMQINEMYHGARARELGIDIYKREGNLEYAMYLYRKEGLRPWSASKFCWSGSINTQGQEIASR